MRKIFWEDPYKEILETRVCQVEGDSVVFDTTIGFSECGGQESDRITINNSAVLSSRMDRSSPFLIYYTLEKGHALAPGDVVVMRIDPMRRKRLMRLHFACELVLVLMNRLFNGTPPGVEIQPEEIDAILKKRGAHIAEDSARIDFECTTPISEYFPRILSEYDAIIAADLPIEKGFLDENSELRYWRLPNIARVLCGGTHVNSTGEVGSILLKRERANKGVERIRIRLRES